MAAPAKDTPRLVKPADPDSMVSYLAKLSVRERLELNDASVAAALALRRAFTKAR